MIYFIVESSDYYMNGQENGNNNSNNNLHDNVQFSMSDSPFGQFQNNSVDNNVNQPQPVVSTEPQVQNFNFSLNDSPFGQMIAENNEVVNQPTNMVNQTQAPEQSQPVAEENSSKFFNPNVIENSSSGIGQTLYPDPVQNNTNDSVNVSNQTTNVQNNNVVTPNLNKPKKNLFDYLRSFLYTIACLVLLLVVGLFVLRFTCIETLSCTSSYEDSDMGKVTYEYITESLFGKIYHQKIITTIDFSSFDSSERDEKMKSYLEIVDYSDKAASMLVTDGFKLYENNMEKNGYVIKSTIDSYITISNYFNNSVDVGNISEIKSKSTEKQMICVE